MIATPKAVAIDYFTRGYILDWPDTANGWSFNGVAKNKIFVRLLTIAL